ncbi:NB-ARC domain-containing protein [Adonisia turfae]|uniref:WD40 domain-containing protein n=1 Tax=Adonisia turfae TaxID=2950184 RepID=UPI0013CF8542|nr:NB-ARC domain-containing protein [Adonisia turfae]
MTAQGQQKLQSAITELEQTEKLGQKITLEELAEKTGLDPGTVSRVREGEKGCDRKTLDRFFRSLGLELTDADYIKPGTVSAPNSVPESSDHQPKTPVDWGEAVDVSIFYGRTEELAKLKKWILQDRCRLILIQGMGGIGKTALSIKLSENIYKEFDHCIWRSLREAPPVEKILADLIKFLSNQQDVNLPETVGDAVTRLIHYLNNSRCLLILDNAESILEEDGQAGQYRKGYEGYGTLMQRLGESRHQSCLIVTSREKTKEIARQTGHNRPVRTILLQGLEDSVGNEFLKAEGLKDEGSQWQQIFDYYSGNPLALKIVANTIQDLFQGKITNFLQQGPSVFGDIRDLLEQQFTRLSTLGQSLMYWLAIGREPTSIEVLKEAILEPVSTQQLLETLEILRRRSFVELSEEGFTLQNVVMEYLTHRLVNNATKELTNQALELLHSHALMQSTARDYVRETQIRLVLKPLTRNINNLEQQIKEILVSIRQNSYLSSGYAGGNLINLLCQCNSIVRDFDFSSLTLRQAHLRGIAIHNLNLSNSHLVHASFTQMFGVILAAAFSPDGELIATADNRNIQLWQIKNWQHIATFKGHINWIWSLAFSPNGKYLASGSGDATIRIWDINQQKCLHTFNDHTNRIRSITFSPNSQFIASGSEDHTIRIWDINQRKCLHVLNGHTSGVWSVTFNFDGRFLASGSRDSTVRIWDISQQKCLHVFIGHTNLVRAVTFNSNNLLASGSEDSTVRIWDVSQQECLHVFTGHESGVWSVAFSPNGLWLASGSRDSTIRLLDIQKQQCLNVLLGHTNGVQVVAFSSDGQFLASSSHDSTVRIWDIHKQKCLHVFNGHTKGIFSVAFSPTGQHLASGGIDFTIRLWDVEQRKYLYPLVGHTSWVFSVSFSPNDQILASGSEDSTIRIWDIRHQKCLCIFSQHTNWVRSVTFSPKGELLASGSEDATIRIWDINQQKCLHALTGHSDGIQEVVFSPDGRFLASGSNDSTIRIWDIYSQKCLHVFTGHKRVVQTVFFSPDGQFLASGSIDSTIRVWDINQQKCLCVLSGHTNWIRSVAFSPNGRFLASGSLDSTVRLWDIHKQKCLHVFTGHTEGLWSVDFSPNSCSVVSSSEDGTIRLWDVETKKCLTIFQLPLPYEGTNITGTRGLTDIQRASMLSLGAIDENEPSYEGTTE